MLLSLNYLYDTANNIIELTDQINHQIKTYGYDQKNQLTMATTPGIFLEHESTPGNFGYKAADYLGATWMDFLHDRQAVISLDYYASSIGLDFGTTAPGIKKILLTPDPDHHNHRIEQNTLNLYISNDNLIYTPVPIEEWEFTKEENGTISLTLKERLATRYLKIHVRFDDRDQDFTPINKATFLNELAGMVKVYQETDSRTEEYGYDADGNRSSVKLQLVRTFQHQQEYYPNSNRLKTDGKYEYAYDANGNLTTKEKVTPDPYEPEEKWAYTYDLLNRLIKVTKNGTLVAEYGYDPEGFRVVKKANGETNHYVFEGTEPIFEKRVSVKGTATIRSYVYALGKHLARVDGVIGDPEAPVYFYHTDHLGSVRVVTNLTGEVVWNADYFAFGMKYGENPNSDFEEWHGFTGKGYDPDTGLSYFNARWYDSELGRFISEDPAMDGENWYMYCRNNPLILIDPSGETPSSANKLLNQYHEDIIKIAYQHNIPPVLLASVVYNENVKRWAYHDLKDAAAIALSIKQGHDPSIGLCQIQISNAILLDFGLNPKEFAKLTREEQRQIKDMSVAALDWGYREYYIEKLKDPLTNMDYAARYLEFLGEARDYESPELWLSDYNRGLSQYETSLPYGNRYNWIVVKYDFDDYEISSSDYSLDFKLDIDLDYSFNFGSKYNLKLDFDLDYNLDFDNNFDLDLKLDWTW